MKKLHYSERFKGKVIRNTLKIIDGHNTRLYFTPSIKRKILLTEEHFGKFIFITYHINRLEEEFLIGQFGSNDEKGTMVTIATHNRRISDAWITT